MEAEVGRRTAPARCPTRRPLPPADGAAIERAAELLRGAERPVVMAGTGLYWARGEQALQRLCEELQVPVFLNGLARGCVPADHPLFFSRARGTGAEGRRRGARDRRADGLPARLRRLLRRRHGDRRDRRPRRPSARTRARSRRSSTAAWRPRSTRCARPRAGGPRPLRAGSPQLREVENEKRAGEQEELTDDRAPLHPLRVYHELGAGARPRRRRDRRRRRLRLLRRPRDRDLRARLLDGPGPVRLPRRRARATRSRPSSRSPDRPGLPAARRRRLRLLRARVRHDGAPRRCPSSA